MMKMNSAVKLGLSLLLLLTMLWGGASAHAEIPPQIGEVIFHETFDAFTDAHQQIHPGWRSWSDAYCQCEYADSGCRCITPEYRQANPVNAFPYRARGGSGNAQQWFTVHAIHHAGVYRRFEVEPGMILEWHAWAMAWSSADDDPHSYDAGQQVRLQIGIDPTGGTAPLADTVVWSAIHERENPNQWHALPPVRVTAESDRVTVFLSAQPKYPLPHNNIYFDDVMAVYHGFADAGPPVPELGEGAGRIVGATPAAAADPDPALSGLTAPDAPAETGGGMGMFLQVGGALVLGGIFWWTSKREGA